MAELSEDERKWHRKQASSLFNMVWDTMEKADRTPDDDDTMIDAAHASRYHWQLVGDATNLSVGEWQISRVYSLLGRAEPCTYHAQRCLDVTLGNNLAPFYVAYAHEAMGRAGKVAGDRDLAERHHDLAAEAAKGIVEEADRKALEADLETVLP